MDSINKNIKPKLRCAIYTRQSFEEGLDMVFNSLDAQCEACENYIQSQKHEGWDIVPNNYDDEDFSGDNVERPGLKRLIADIKAGMIDIVVVYKIDRLSSSLLDFHSLMQVFEEHKIAFVSVTQNFDSSISMGKLFLNMLVSFAQFEHEIPGMIWSGSAFFRVHKKLESKLEAKREQTKLDTKLKRKPKGQTKNRNKTKSSRYKTRGHL